MRSKTFLAGKALQENQDLLIAETCAKPLVYTINKCAHPFGCINTMPHPFYWTRGRNHLKGHQSLPKANGSGASRLSSLLALSNGSPGTWEFGFFPGSELCCECRKTVLERMAETLRGFSLCPLLFGKCFKMMDHVIATCQMWWHKGWWLSDFSSFARVQGKQSQECQ